MTNGARLNGFLVGCRCSLCIRCKKTSRVGEDKGEGKYERERDGGGDGGGGLHRASLATVTTTSPATSSSPSRSRVRYRECTEECDRARELPCNQEVTLPWPSRPL